MRCAVAFASLLLTAAPVWAADPSNLVATDRSDTTLTVQWDGGGNSSFTLDYLGPEYFPQYGGGQPSCNDFPMHNNIFETSNTTETIVGLQPDTWYHIHVHMLDPNAAGGTNVIIVKTLPAGSGSEPLTLGSPDYIICGGGGGGGGETECAKATFTLLPRSEVLPEVHVTVLDPSSGTDLTTFSAPIGEPQDIPEGSHHLQFSAPPGYAVTPVRTHLNAACGDDFTIRLRFRLEP